MQANQRPPRTEFWTVPPAKVMEWKLDKILGSQANHPTLHNPLGRKRCAHPLPAGLQATSPMGSICIRVLPGARFPHWVHFHRRKERATNNRDSQSMSILGDITWEQVRELSLLLSLRLRKSLVPTYSLFLLQPQWEVLLVYLLKSRAAEPSPTKGEVSCTHPEPRVSP